jgi:hypothetical protein
MFQGDKRECLPKLLEQYNQPIDFMAEPEADIGRDLIIARAASMKTLTRITHELYEPLFNIEMDIFEIQKPLEATLIDFSQNLHHSAFDIAAILRRDHFDSLEHLGMCQGALDIETR